MNDFMEMFYNQADVDPELVDEYSDEFNELLRSFALEMFENGDRFADIPKDVDEWTIDFWPKYRDDNKTREYKLRFGNTSAGTIIVPPSGKWQYKPDCLAPIVIEIDAKELDAYVMDWSHDRICFNLLTTK